MKKRREFFSPLKVRRLALASITPTISQRCRQPMGFTLVEILVTLAVLSIVLVYAHRTFLHYWQRYQCAVSKCKALQYAQLEMAKAEAQLLYGHPMGKFILSHDRFRIYRQITHRSNRLLRVQVKMVWKDFGIPQVFTLEQDVLAGNIKNEKQFSIS